MRTVEGVTYPSYRETCVALGIAENDDSLHESLQEARIMLLAPALRGFMLLAPALRGFMVDILNSCQPSDPRELFWKNASFLSVDYLHVVEQNAAGNGYCRANDNDVEDCEQINFDNEIDSAEEMKLQSESSSDESDDISDDASDSNEMETDESAISSDATAIASKPCSRKTN